MLIYQINTKFNDRTQAVRLNPAYFLNENVESDADDDMGDDDDDNDDEAMSEDDGGDNRQKLSLTQLNLLLMQLQQQQMMQWQILDAIRKKLAENELPTTADLAVHPYLMHPLINPTLRGSLNSLGLIARSQMQLNDTAEEDNGMSSDGDEESASLADQPLKLTNGNESAVESGEDKDRTATSVGSSGPQRHKCKLCYKVLGSDSALQIHMRSHTGERPYKCNVCGNRFTTKGNLKVHFQRHLEQHPHVRMNPHPVPEHLDSHPSASLALPLTPLFDEAPWPASSLQPATTQEDDKPMKICDAKKSLQFEPEKKDGLMQVSHARMLQSFAGQLSSQSPLSALSSMSSALTGTNRLLNDNQPRFPKLTPIFPQFPPPIFSTSLPALQRMPTLASKEDEMLEQYMEIEPSENGTMDKLFRENEGKIGDPNECGICHRVLSCRSALQMHYRTHTGERPFKCKLCSRTFTTKGNLKTHMSVHKGKNVPRMLHRCSICGRDFTNPIILQQHLLSHNISDKNLFLFNQAGFNQNPFFRFPVNNFINHMMNQRNINPNVKIENLESKIHEERTKLVETDSTKETNVPNSTYLSPPFQPQHNLINALYNYSSIAQPARLPQVVDMSNSFTSKEEPKRSDAGLVRSPMPTSPVRDGSPLSRTAASCAICGKHFACRSALDIHYRSHTKERPFQCHLCERAFTTKGNLKQHVGSAHIGENVNESSKSGSDNNSTSFDMFSKADDLSKNNKTINADAQMSLEKNEKYECHACKVYFDEKNQLQDHLKMHAEDKKSCSFCDLIFKSQESLEEHLRLQHNADGKYQARKMMLNNMNQSEKNMPTSVLSPFPFQYMPPASNYPQMGIPSIPRFNGGFDIFRNYSSLMLPNAAGHIGMPQDPLKQNYGLFLFPQQGFNKQNFKNDPIEEKELNLSVKKNIDLPTDVSFNPSHPLTSDTYPQVALNCR